MSVQQEIKRLTAPARAASLDLALLIASLQPQGCGKRRHGRFQVSVPPLLSSVKTSSALARAVGARPAYSSVGRVSGMRSRSMRAPNPPVAPSVKNAAWCPNVSAM
jgi:hypothetical protein